MNFRFDFGEDGKDNNMVIEHDKENPLLRECRLYSFGNRSFQYTIETLRQVKVCDKIIYYRDVEDIDEAITELEMIKTASHTDLKSGVYEGGFKVWECTYDLLDFLQQNEELINHKRVLDLGCGLGLLGTFACLCEASEVIFQDYNNEVIEHFTMTTVACTKQFVRFNTSTTFLSGDWDDVSRYFTENNFDKYDLILSSETIYNEDYYSKLLNILHSHLAVDGVALFAAKSFYFGVGGGTLNFSEYIRNNGNFNVVAMVTTLNGLTREILKICHKH